jgi:hypothetical protein
LIGPLASSGQITNAALVSCLYHLATTLDAAGPDFSVKAFEVLRPPILVRLLMSRPKAPRLTQSSVHSVATGRSSNL